MTALKPEQILTPAEVSKLFHVDPKTVTRWALKGILRTHTRTAGGHRRYLGADVQALIDRGAGDD